MANPGVWVVIIILIGLSGTFSGLTLGLLSLDLIGLEIVIASGSETEAKYARRIYPLRKRGNLLLCTLLLGNVAVNALISILLADVTSGFMGFLISTITIVIFGEITPQSICQRHGLMIGYYTVWMVWIFLIFLFPAAYPISLCLDRLLGQELGTIYSRMELKKLLDIQSHVIQSDLTKAETKVLAAALDFGVKEVGEIMTPIDQVFMLEINERLSHGDIREIVQTGYSRIPIYETDRNRITGMLFAKDLALLNPDHEVIISDILPNLNRPLPRVFADTPLNDMLAEFKTGSSHMAIVRTVNSDGPGDPVYENVGVVTLEDVFEELIGDEIDDEIDSRIGGKKGKLIRMSTVPQSQPEKVLKLNKETIESLTKYLRSQVRAFKKKKMSSAVLKRLLAQTTINVIEPASMEENKVQYLYTEGQQASFFTIILSGKVVVSVKGSELDRIGTKEGSGQFACMGEASLKVPKYRADFSAKPQGHVRFVKIFRTSYIGALEASQVERKRKGFLPFQKPRQEEQLDFGVGISDEPIFLDPSAPKREEKREIEKEKEKEKEKEDFEVVVDTRDPRLGSSILNLYERESERERRFEAPVDRVTGEGYDDRPEI